MILEPLPRRTFLKGLGTLMGLPLLEAMLPSHGAEAFMRKVGANRMAFVFVPNGIHMQDWRPTVEGKGFVLPPTLEPLSKVKDSLSVLTGLTQDKARANGDGGGDHARSTSAFLTGCQPRKTAGADIKVGVSADQIAAQKIGHLTRFPSLEIGCERGAQAGNCDSGYSCAYSSSISWRSENTPMAKEVNPRQVFERLFGSGDTQDDDESKELRAKYRKSMLDFVLEDATKLKTQLGAHDRLKLDEYFTSVREIEQRLNRSETGEISSAGIDKPSGVPVAYQDHIRLMADMMVLAFQSDLTRIATFMFANDGSNRSYRSIGVPEGHHDLSHHGGNKEKQAKIKIINKFHVEQLAYMLEKMQSIKEGNGTLLDNSMIVYGAGISDGDRHNHDDLPILLAGKGGGTVAAGRHVIYPRETPMTNLFLSMLDRMGVRTDKLGDSTGRLEHLSI